MKKILLALVLVLIVMTYGFANGQQETEKTKTIELWSLFTEGNPMNGVVADTIARFEADNPNVKINHVTAIDKDYKTKMKVAMGSKTEGDVMFTWGGTMSLLPMVEAERVVDLSPYLEADMEWADRFLPSAMAFAQFPEYPGTWGVPVFAGASLVSMNYRKDIFAEYNLEEPKTWDEFISVMDTLLANDITPLALGNKVMWPGSFWFMILVDRIAGPSAWEKASVPGRGGSFTDAPFIEAGEMIQDLVDRGYFGEGYNSRNWEAGDTRTQLYTGAAAMEWMGSWTLGQYGVEQPDMEFGFFNFPPVPGGKGDASNSIGAMGGLEFVITKNCEYVDEAVEFLKYAADDMTVKNQVVNANSVPPMYGVENFLGANPQMKNFFEKIVAPAANVQYWFQEDVPAEISQTYLDVVKAIFGGADVRTELQRLEDAKMQYHNR